MKLSKLNTLNRSRLFIFLLFALCFLKFWLVAGLGIAVMPYDPVRYLEEAKDWYWGQEFAANTFYRPPLFQVFVAGAAAIGLPLRTAFELLFLTSAVSLTIALEKLLIPRAVILLSFVLIIFHPYAIRLFSIVAPECFVVSLELFLVGAVIFAVTTQGRIQIVSALLFGGFAALIMFSRGETILITSQFVIFGVAIVLFYLLRRISFSVARSLSTNLIAIPVTVCCFFALVIASLNFLATDRFSPWNDIQQKEFLRAYNDLQAISGPVAIRFVPVSREQMQLAEKVSPAFREIQPYLTGEGTQNYYDVSKTILGSYGEIAGGWWIWLFRQAVAGAGYYKTPARAEAYYSRLADELEEADSKGLITLQRFPIGLMDPKYEAWIDYLPSSFKVVFELAFPSDAKAVPRDDPKLSPATYDLYRSVAGYTAVSEASYKWPDAFLSLARYAYNWILLLFALSGAVVMARNLGKQNPHILFPLLSLILMFTGRWVIFMLLDASSYPIQHRPLYIFPASILVAPMIVIAFFSRSIDVSYASIDRHQMA